MTFLIIAGVFFLGFLGLVVWIRFPMEATIRELEKELKKAKQELDNAKGKLAKLKSKALTGDPAREEAEKAADKVDAVLAQIRDEGAVPQAWFMMAATWCVGFTLYFVILGLTKLAHPSLAWAWFFLSLIGIGYYVFDIIRDYLNWKKSGGTREHADIDIVQPDEVGMKLFLGKPYSLVSPGPRYAPSLFVKIIHFPTQMFLYKLREDNVMTAGPESAPWTLHMSVKFQIIRDVWNLVRFLGTDLNEIINKLTGEIDSTGHRTTRGIIGDEMTAIARAFIGDVANIRTVDDGLAAQNNIAAVIDKFLELSLRHLGLTFEFPNITDFDVIESVRTARADRTAEQIGVGKAQHIARQRAIAGQGEGRYQRNILEQKIAAVQSIGYEQQMAKTILLAVVAGGDDIAKLKDALKLNINAFEGVSGLLGQLGQVISGKGDRNQLLNSLNNMSDRELENLMNQIKRLREGDKR